MITCVYIESNPSTMSTTAAFGGGQFKESTPMELRYESLNLFFGTSENFDIAPTSGGVNNIMEYVTNKQTGE